MNTVPFPSVPRSVRAGFFLLTWSGLFLAALGGCENRVTTQAPFVLTTVRVSLNSVGDQGTAEVVNPVTVTHNERPGISDDGRFIVFSSKAPNIVTGDVNLVSDVFLRDNMTRATTLISVNTGGATPGDDASTAPSISGNGRFVVFQSKATNLTADATGGFQQIFVRDVQLGTTTLVSRSTGTLGIIANTDCFNPRISQNGSFVVFQTNSNVLDGVVGGGDDNDTGNTGTDIYRRDLVTNTTVLISMISGAAPGSGPANKGSNASVNASISGDGNLIAFDSLAPNLVPLGIDGGPDTNNVADIFVRNATTNRTIRVSLGKAGGPIDPNNASSNGFISANGQVVIFQSNAFNLVPEDDSAFSDIFVRDLVAGTTEIISVHSSGAQAGQNCNNPALDTTGRFAVFQSPSPNLVNGDANNVSDTFLRDRNTQVTQRISVSTFGSELNGISLRPMISGNGTYVVFYTEASNAADDDNNGTGDIYLRGPPF